eukprot:3772232-Prymnesium_polylepis.1
MLSTTMRVQEPLRDDVSHRCAPPGAFRTRRSEHGGPISHPPHTPIAARAASASDAVVAQMVKSAT